MARISKVPIAAFKENIKIAKGFVKLHFYISDLLSTGGEASIGQLIGFANQMMESFGLGAKTLEKRVERVGSEIEFELLSLGEEAIKGMTQSVLTTLRPQLEEAMVTFEEVKAAVETGLLQQSLVIAVSALEVYLHDVTVEAVSKNRYIEQRFTKQLSKKFDYDRLRRAGHDVRKAVGESVGESYRFYDPKSVRRHLRTLLNRKPTLESQTDLRQFRSIVAYRNLIAHRAGKVDDGFKRATSYRGSVGSCVKIPQKFVEDSLAFAESIAIDVQGGLEKQRAKG